MWESWSDLTDRYRDWFANRVDASEDTFSVSERGHARAGWIELTVIGISVTAIIMLCILTTWGQHGSGSAPSTLAVILGFVGLFLPVPAVILLSRHLRSRTLVIERAGSAVLTYRYGLLRRTFRADVREVVIRIYAISFHPPGLVTEMQHGYVLSAQINTGFICMAAVPKEEYERLQSVIDSFPPWIRSRVQHSLTEVWFGTRTRFLGPAGSPKATSAPTQQEGGGP